MRIETHGQQIDVTSAMRDYVDSKLARLGRHFDQPLDVRALLSVDKTEHRAEGTINFAGGAVHARAIRFRSCAHCAGPVRPPAAAAGARNPIRRRCRWQR